MRCARQALSFALVALSLLQLSDAYAIDARTGSNAQRLARGLPPALPKRLYNAHYSESCVFCDTSSLLNMLAAQRLLVLASHRTFRQLQLTL